MLGPIFSGEILAAFLKSLIVRLHGRANGNFHHEVLIFVFSWDSALLAPRWWLRIIPKGCSHMISRFATPTFLFWCDSASSRIFLHPFGTVSGHDFQNWPWMVAFTWPQGTFGQVGDPPRVPCWDRGRGGGHVLGEVYSLGSCKETRLNSGIFGYGRISSHNRTVSVHTQLEFNL